MALRNVLLVFLLITQHAWSVKTPRGSELTESEDSDVPLRPRSPLSWSEDFYSVGDLARPGPGVTPKTPDHLLIEAAVVMARHCAPEVDASQLNTFKKAVRKEMAFLKEERHTGDWRTLVNRLEEEGQDSFNLIGYGSLLDEASSLDFPRRGDSILAFGAKRFFGFLPSTPERSPLGMPRYKHAQQRLTVDYTGNYNDTINGILLNVKLGKEFSALYEREKGYDLIQIPVVRFVSPECTMIDKAYILASPRATSSTSCAASSTFTPHMGYLYICLRGSMSAKESMPPYAHPLPLFLFSTYVGEKTLAQWIEDHPGESLPKGRSPRSHFQALRSDHPRPLSDPESS